jgi:hypothetical protein
MPSLTVNVVEKRATESGHRSLARDKELYIPSAFISRTRVFPTWPDPGPDVAVIEEALTRLCPSLASLLRVEGGFHLLGFLPSYAPTRRDIRINRLELELAKVAQKKGVRIYHDNGITDLASIESRYTNEYTLVVFDATGGRLIPVEFPKINTYTPPAVVPDKKLNTEHRTERVVPIYEGHLDPRSALRVLASSLYAPIGDTFMKVDFRAASPGTVNGMSMVIFSVYGPINVYPIAAKQKFYEELENELTNVPREFKSRVFMGGDFNARIGVFEKGVFDNCRGEIVDGIQNENGLLLMEFCLRNSLFVC